MRVSLRRNSAIGRSSKIQKGDLLRDPLRLALSRTIEPFANQHLNANSVGRKYFAKVATVLVENAFI